MRASLLTKIWSSWKADIQCLTLKTMKWAAPWTILCPPTLSIKTELRTWEVALLLEWMMRQFTRHSSMDLQERLILNLGTKAQIWEAWSSKWDINNLMAPFLESLLSKNQSLPRESHILKNRSSNWEMRRFNLLKCLNHRDRTSSLRWLSKKQKPAWSSKS